MDMEAGKTLTNEEVIRELLELLKKNAMKEQANDVFEICSYVDGLEKKIDSMTEELTNMQNQIKEMQEDTLVNNAKKALSEAQERLNVRCEQIKSQVLEVKAQVKSTAKSIVDVYMRQAQRPPEKSTLMADYDTWKKVGRYVKRGAKGCAIFPSRALNPRMRYIFDISDTGGKNVKLTWDLEGENLKDYVLSLIHI